MVALICLVMRSLKFYGSDGLIGPPKVIDSQCCFDCLLIYVMVESVHFVPGRAVAECFLTLQVALIV
ncbi:hypothetical protein PsalMR5_03881 [Piscirickettsia salmonis]|nr:hypothetical protein PsalSR1_03882 [Piscirickettsia salmonis]QGP57738.1 hypothetical protein PsalBI1_00276 [Piscirickettsia salmonis]QGP65961.1 hypothetical protein PsalMR5_03881 [Piscirickettsia salmonis]